MTPLIWLFAAMGVVFMLGFILFICLFFATRNRDLGRYTTVGDLIRKR